MAEKKFTFIELHLDGETQFGPKAIGDALPLGGPVEDETATETDDEGDAAGAEEGSKGTALGVVVGLLALVAVAAAVKRFRGDDDEGLEHEEEPEIIVN